MALPWSPCEQLHRSATLKNIRQGLLFLQETFKI
jgi:Ni/Fe-hydrogenase subunit HybB-like protein